MATKFRHIDYSKSKYVKANGLTEESTPNRYVTYTNEEKNEVIHMVDITLHPKELLPGGKGTK